MKIYFQGLGHCLLLCIKTLSIEGTRLPNALPAALGKVAATACRSARNSFASTVNSTALGKLTGVAGLKSASSESSSSPSHLSGILFRQGSKRREDFPFQRSGGGVVEIKCLTASSTSRDFKCGNQPNTGKCVLLWQGKAPVLKKPCRTGFARGSLSIAFVTFRKDFTS